MQWTVSFSGRATLPAGAGKANLVVSVIVEAGTIGAALIKAENLMSTWKIGANFETISTFQDPDAPGEADPLVQTKTDNWRQ